VPGSRRGEGNFDTGKVSYFLLIEGQPAFERRELGARTYIRPVGEDVYYESDESPEALAARTVRKGFGRLHRRTQGSRAR
jgi:hypothetical protein